MSLYEDRIITPAMAYEMKKLKEGEVLEWKMMGIKRK